MKKKFTTNLSKECLENLLPQLRFYYKVNSDNLVIEQLIKEKVDEINGMEIKREK